MRLSPEEAAHLRVLRAAVGDAVTLFDGAGLTAEAVIIALDETGATLEAGPPQPESRETPQPVILAVALLKGDKLADVVRAGTELGAAEFRLLVTARSEAKEIGLAKLERLRRVALEAAKQSGRAHVPSVLEPVRLEALGPVGRGLVAHPGGSRRPAEALVWDGSLWLATGPEGGFTEAEIAALEARGFLRVGLGPRVLRAETAPLALLAAVTAAEGV